MELGKKTFIVKEGDAVRIKPKTVHRIYAKFGDVKIIEVSTPHLKDRVRIEDDYGRENKT
jgi:mannose-6-phosphate isomerase-like protein (cupin superfamily)